MKVSYERFTTPVINKNTIKRQRISWQIDELSPNGILFVHSPAGYGKTTAVALWAQDRNTLWLSLDAYSCEPDDIYKSLLSALSREIPERFADSPLKSTLNELENIQNWPQALVIDDFHLCTDFSMAQTLPLIRARMPMQTAFIIISRNPPPSVLIEQTLKGVVKQICSLQFSDDEIAVLFKKNNLALIKEEAEAIGRQTDGWAAALAAIILASGNIPLGAYSSDILNSDTLHNYLKTHVDYGDNYHVLKICSVCDILNPGLCNTITGQNNAWDIVSAFAEKTGLVAHLGRDTYSFHALLKEFLESELSLDKTIDKQTLYKTAAGWFKENGDILRALDMASKSRELAMLEEYLRIRFDQYGKFEADIARYVLATIKYVYNEIPADVIKQSLRLSLDCFSAMFSLGRIQESFEWIDAAEELLWSRQNTATDINVSALYIFLDPRKNVRDIPDRFLKIKPLLSAAQSGKLSLSTLTFNLPFFHKSHVDYTEVSLELDEFLSGVLKYMKPVLGSMLKPLVLLLTAGVRYERGELEEAEKTAGEIVQMAHNFPPEIQFSALALYIEILRVQGKKFNLENISAMISAARARYLNANYNAYLANIHLYDGDTDTAQSWLAQSEVESTLMFYKVYQYFTTVRAYMAIGKLSAALTLLERLAALTLIYRRPTDYIEALTLQSICLWHIKRPADSVEVMVKAIIRAHELQLVMPITKEGGDILPVLQKILNRLKYGYDTDKLDKSFVNRLFFGAQTMSQFRGIMVKGKNKPVKLPPRQLEILKFLEQNMSYKEISDKMGIKVTTVDDHIHKIYERLGVSSARDAVLKARKLGIG
jgi:LuxR family maltose regulon positive regulatory protein